VFYAFFSEKWMKMTFKNAIFVYSHQKRSFFAIFRSISLIFRPILLIFPPFPIKNGPFSPQNRSKIPKIGPENSATPLFPRPKGTAFGKITAKRTVLERAACVFSPVFYSKSVVLLVILEAFWGRKFRKNMRFSCFFCVRDGFSHFKKVMIDDH
jgi:hypothetical protein